MKATKVIFWVSTTIIFLFQGVMPALFSQQKESIEGFTHLGYPVYFVTVLTVFKVLGTLALIIPQVPRRIKEWAYAGLTFDFLCASISYFIVDGIVFLAFFPLIILVILMASYFSYHKLNKPV
jgi:DoxX-like family